MQPHNEEMAKMRERVAQMEKDSVQGQIDVSTCVVGCVSRSQTSFLIVSNVNIVPLFAGCSPQAEREAQRTTA